MTTHDDFTMAYMDSCDQIPLLLLHGFPLDSSMWELQFQDLQDAARLIAPDMRGHGRSETPPPPYSMATLAADCAGLLDHLSITRPVVVCGLSMGGYVALEFYRRYPDAVAGLILTATRAVADTEEGKAGRDQMAKIIAERGMQPIANAMIPKLFSPHTLSHDNELPAYVQDIILETHPDGAIGALAAMKTRADSTPTLADIDVPTLIIHGANDKIVPLEEAQAMAKAIDGAELLVIPDAGHLPNLEQPEIFNDAVFDFMEKLHGHDHDHDHENGE